MSQLSLLPLPMAAENGFTPLVWVNVLRPPDEVIATIVDALERLADSWR
jgi:hypothetical protein